jgi:hypothetical protein
MFETLSVSVRIDILIYLGSIIFNLSFNCEGGR